MSQLTSIQLPGKNRCLLNINDIHQVLGGNQERVGTGKRKGADSVAETGIQYSRKQGYSVAGSGDAVCRKEGYSVARKQGYSIAENRDTV